MSKIIIYLLLLVNINMLAQDIGGDYYVSTTGDDNNAGTDSSSTGAWKTFQKAFNVAQPGDTVYFMGGIYYSTQTSSIDPKAYVPIGNSGTAENPICYFGYPGEWAILDCSLHCNTPGVSYNGGIYIGNAQYIHFKGFELRNVFQCDATITGGISSIYSTNLTFEHIVMHDVGQRGFYISGGAWGEFTQDPAPSWDYDTTRFINCDVYDLVDTVTIGSPFPNPGNAADAWKTSCYGGNYFVWDGCRAWNYSDDGVDATSNEGGTQLFNNCWFMSSNKWEEYGVEGNGLKLSAIYSPGNGYQNDVFVTVKNSIFVYAGASGAGIVNNIFMGQEDHFLNNGAFYNNLSYRNGYGFFEFGYADSLSTSTYKNNISFGSREIAAGSGRPMDFYNRASFINESHNTFDFVRGYPGFVSTDTVSFSDDDYIGIDSLTIVSQFTAPRKPDGSLPDFPCFRLATGSDLIGAGTNVGMSATPDIGIDWAYLDAQSEPDSTANDITGFAISGQTGSSTINFTNHTVGITMPYGTDVTNLTPTISVSSGAIISPTSGTARNFTSPQTYTVTALDGETEQVWTVTVTVDSAPTPSTGRKVTRGSNGRVMVSGNGHIIYTL